MRTALAVLTVLSSLSSFALNAHGRTWTDLQGNKTNAQFVRVHEGMVVLLRGNTPLRFPFEGFSKEDQQYLRKLLEAEGKGDLLPPEQASVEGGENASMPARTWTDQRGNRVTGRLVKVEGEDVYLQVNGQTRRYPTSGFSPVDQEVIRNWVAQNPGSGAQPGHMPSTGPDPNRMTVAQTHAELVRRQQQAMQRQQEQGEDPLDMPRQQSIPGERERDGPNEEQRHREREQQTRSEYERRASPQAVAQQEANERQNALLAEREAWKRLQNDPHASTPHFAVSICDRACGKCNRAIPNYAQVGERCPWCGTVWAVETDCSGKVIASNISKSGFGRFVQVCMGIGLWIVVIWAVIAALRIVRSVAGRT